MIDIPELYEKLYVHSIRSQLYNYCNILLVIHQIRKACIVTIKPEMFESVREILKNYRVIIKEYIKPGVYIISWISEVYDPIIGKILKLNKKNNDFNIKTGEILQYLTPINIKHVNGGDKHCLLLVDIYLLKSTLTNDKSPPPINLKEDRTFTISLMPQRVLNKTDDEIKEYYTPAFNFFKNNMNNFEKFIITNVEIIIKKPTNGGKRKTRKSKKKF